MPQTLAQIKEMLTQRALAPQKMFGQNFLIDHNLIRKLVDASGVGPGDIVLEVGPGTGTLTEELLARGCRVIGCDIDRGLCALLRERFGPASRLIPAGASFTLLEGDCLDGKHALSPDLAGLLGELGIHAGASNASTNFRLISNLPYGCATPVMMILLSRWPACMGLFVTIQKEVGDRMIAGPSTKEYGPLSLLAQSVAKVEWIAKLPPSCFWPAPDVTSAMIGVRRVSTPRTLDPAGLLAFTQKVFEQRRKQLGSVLGTLGLVAADILPPSISPTVRAEALSVDQLIALHERAKEKSPGIAPGL